MVPWRAGSQVPDNRLCHPDPEQLTLEAVRDWHLRTAAPCLGVPAPPLVRDDHERLAGAVGELIAGAAEGVREVLREAVAYHRRCGTAWPTGWGPTARGAFHRAAAELLTKASLAVFA